MTIILFIIITNKLKKSMIDTLFYARNHKIVHLAQYRCKNSQHIYHCSSNKTNCSLNHIQIENNTPFYVIAVVKMHKSDYVDKAKFYL